MKPEGRKTHTHTHTVKNRHTQTPCIQRPGKCQAGFTRVDKYEASQKGACSMAGRQAGRQHIEAL